MNERTFVRCWLCHSPCQVKFSKKDKPYLVCLACGLQTFIRGDRAEQLLLEKVRKGGIIDNGQG